MSTVREYLRAIAYGEQLAHEDELIDLFQQHAVAALKILDDAEHWNARASVYDPEPAT